MVRVHGNKLCWSWHMLVCSYECNYCGQLNSLLSTLKILLHILLKANLKVIWYENRFSALRYPIDLDRSQKVDFVISLIILKFSLRSRSLFDTVNTRPVLVTLWYDFTPAVLESDVIGLAGDDVNISIHRDRGATLGETRLPYTMSTYSGFVMSRS